ncbi:MAG: hypothetical protein JW818_06280 [Pirellulales bacterium]|nr:hypothetical protein [Pirellulales bacterium]
MRDEMKRLSEKYLETTGTDHVGVEGVAVILEAMIPMVRDVVRSELKAIRPLEDDWYEPSEVAAMSCGKISAETVRTWFRWGQLDGESDGRQVRLYKSAVEELRRNKWRPVRPPDETKLPPSKKSLGLSRRSAT